MEQEFPPVEDGAPAESESGLLQVSLTNFDGPLDLLLHLVRKQELDIHELRLAELTEPYLAYVERMAELNLDQAGEFLAIAATLVWIKSKALLPKEEREEEELDPETVEEMLLLRLQEYQRIKEAAFLLDSRDRLGRELFPRAPSPDEDETDTGLVAALTGEADSPEEVAVNVEEVSLFDLIGAFQDVLKRSRRLTQLHVVPERQRVEDKLDEMLKRLAHTRSILFHEFFSDMVDRPEIILTFIALLELVRMKALRVTQSGVGGTIYCQVTDAFVEDSAGFRRAVLAIIGHEVEETPAVSPVEN